MKYIISLSLICFCFVASANDLVISEVSKEQTIEMSVANNPGKKSRRNKRINKKRKRKCGQFARKGFAG